MIKNKILLIDDDHFNSFALLTFLRGKGFECFSATGAREGIEILLKESDIGIVLMDMIMPDMDGYEATVFIKENAMLMHIPVIAVTAQAMEGDKEKCLNAGAEEYVSKPVDIEALMTLLNEYIR